MQYSYLSTFLSKSVGVRDIFYLNNIEKYDTMQNTSCLKKKIILITMTGWYCRLYMESMEVGQVITKNLIEGKRGT